MTRGKGYGNSKGYNQSSDSKGKGKADKGKGKTKNSGKDTRSVACHKCHKTGHHARDFWSKEKVRQVNEKVVRTTHTPIRAHNPRLPQQVFRAAKVFEESHSHLTCKTVKPRLQRTKPFVQ